MNSLIILQYKTNYDVVAQFTPSQTDQLTPPPPPQARNNNIVPASMYEVCKIKVSNPQRQQQWDQINVHVIMVKVLLVNIWWIFRISQISSKLLYFCFMYPYICREEDCCCQWNNDSALANENASIF